MNSILLKDGSSPLFFRLNLDPNGILIIQPYQSSIYYYRADIVVTREWRNC